MGHRKSATDVTTHLQPIDSAGVSHLDRSSREWEALGGGEFRRTPESETATPPGLTSLPFRPSDTLDEKGLFSLAPRLCRGVGRRALCHQSGLVSSTEQCSPAERARRGSQPDSDHSANSFRGNLKACFFFVHSDFRGRAKRRLIVVCCYETYRDGQREEEENSWESFLVFPFFY